MSIRCALLPCGPFVLRTVHWSLAVANYCTNTTHMRDGDLSLFLAEFPWQIDIQLVRALGLAMLAHFVVALSM